MRLHGELQNPLASKPEFCTQSMLRSLSMLEVVKGIVKPVVARERQRSPGVVLEIVFLRWKMMA